MIWNWKCAFGNYVTMFIFHHYFPSAMRHLFSSQILLSKMDAAKLFHRQQPNGVEVAEPVINCDQQQTWDPSMLAKETDVSHLSDKFLVTQKSSEIYSSEVESIIHIYSTAWDPQQWEEKEIELLPWWMEWKYVRWLKRNIDIYIKQQTLANLRAIPPRLLKRIA